MGPTPEPYRADYLKLRSVLYDRATGLPAVPVLFDQLRTWLDDRREIGVVHVEVANLELVESLYGWQVFDRVVAHSARCLKAGVPDGALLALNGVAGDRFVVFVAEGAEAAPIDAATLAGLGRSLCAGLQAAFDDDDFSEMSPTLCFRAGHALLSWNPFYRFERCVYAAVEEARGLHERVERRRELSWGEELQRIIQSAAVEVVFQPVVELDGGDVVGHEALVRGPRETLFELPSAMFALSGRTGVSAELDRMCCETTLAAFAGLVVGGKCFVNLLPDSAEQQAWRSGRLPALLDQLDLQRADLVLEVSERGVSGDPGGFIEGLERIKDEGFTLALDDVGTGRASLETIERARPDYVKLDVSLVRGIHRNLIQQEALLTLVRLAERVGALVIAEGVETEAEAELLAASGAGLAQGYYFAVPGPVATAGPLRPGKP